MIPAVFIKYLKNVHEQREHTVVDILPFRVDETVMERMTVVIKGGGEINKSERRDEVHVEMLQVIPVLGARLMT